ncbi:hypothetical protein LJ737_17235 [Hymenobacter sp. 15J16-1T3B]|uniref:hypothetical protein n=1 Tax=Hymenobacter sp. 15J16-1T3B TaxID=2886941 RepID=UPI001D12BE13|nr:hypothetical protein [Hymenobacter sp. 15J16-1T3B]MCC3158990.1 hypothetical protein [Hymenobacter sp. 15J16-1T3B]
MDDATLAFYQQLYAGTPLYVVPERPAAPRPAGAAPVAAAAPAAEPAAHSPAPVPTASVVPAPAAVAPPATPSASESDPPAPGRLPSLADLRAARQAAVAPAPVPAPAAPTPPPVAAAPPVEPAAAPVRQPTPFDTLGSNANGLVLLVRLDDPERLPRMQRNVFLNNMLKAIERVMEECVIVNVRSPYPVSLEDLRARGLAVREVIGFGKNLLDVATKRTQPYEPVRIGDVAYLPAAEVEIIEYDNGRKKQLWQALQRMFLG